MALKKLVMQAANKGIEQYAEKIEALLKEEVHVQSGALRDSITTEKKGDGHFLVGVDSEKLRNDPRNAGGQDYSIFYHDGHRGYTIRAKNAKALRWIGKDGQVKFAKSVHIPASAGDPFVARAVKRRPKI